MTTTKSAGPLGRCANPIAGKRKDYNSDLCIISQYHEGPLPAELIVLGDFSNSQFCPIIVHIGDKVLVVNSIQKKTEGISRKL